MATLRSRSGLVLATDFVRVVHGGRGNYIECADSQVVKANIHVPPEAAWRLEPRYYYAYYVEWRSNCPSNVKLYQQRKLVSYADYKIGMWYIAEGEVTHGNADGGLG